MIILRDWHVGWMPDNCRLGAWERAVCAHLALLGHHCSGRGPPGCWQLCHPAITLLGATRASQILSSSLQARCRHHQTGLQGATHLVLLMTQTSHSGARESHQASRHARQVRLHMHASIPHGCALTCTLLWRPTSSRDALVGPYVPWATATHQLTHDSSSQPTRFAHALHPLHPMGTSSPPVASLCTAPLGTPHTYSWPQTSYSASATVAPHLATSTAIHLLAPWRVPRMLCACTLAPGQHGRPGTTLAALS